MVLKSNVLIFIFEIHIKLKDIAFWIFSYFFFYLKYLCSIFQNRETKSCLINHAEINAILYASRQPYYACMVYSPCVHCAKTIAASKIKRIYFIQQYTKGSDQKLDLKYEEIFKFYGIDSIQLNNKSIEKILHWIRKDHDFLDSLYVKP